MAKRQHMPKRRDRKTGESPYAKYKKVPYKYSWQSDKKAGEFIHQRAAGGPVKVA